MKHLMVDLETWAIRRRVAIRSIGAIWFCPEKGALGKEFYLNVDDPEGVRDASTVRWWESQAQKEQKLLQKDPVPFVLAMQQFSDFAKGVEFIWSHGAGFDVAMLETRLKGKVPWEYHGVRDTRTLFHVAGIPWPPFVGVPHYALDDARDQARHVIRCWKRCTAKTG